MSDSTDPKAQERLINEILGVGEDPGLDEETLRLRASTEAGRRRVALFAILEELIRFDRQHPEAKFPWEETEIPADGIEALWELWHEAKRYKRAADRLRSHLEGLMLADVIEHGAIRLGEQSFRAGKSGSWRILPDMRGALFEWLGDELAEVLSADPILISKVRALAALRVTGDPAYLASVVDLDSKAAKRALDERVQAVVDTFYRWEPTREGSDLDLKVEPVSRNRWAEDLEHGERRG